jgi:hypothetical protein
MTEPYRTICHGPLGVLIMYFSYVREYKLYFKLPTKELIFNLEKCMVMKICWRARDVVKMKCNNDDIKKTGF